jgi:protein-disulfide isomerase
MHTLGRLTAVTFLLLSGTFVALGDDATPAATSQPAASAPGAAPDATTQPAAPPDAATTPASPDASAPATAPDVSVAMPDAKMPLGPAAATVSMPAKLPEGVKPEMLADLLVAGPLGDMGLGDPKAPVTVIEYASMTCPHCQRFHSETFPYLKEKYIDTGKVYFIFREYPLDDLALAASMLARCAPVDKYFPAINILFDMQSNWADAKDPGQAVFGYLQPMGFTADSFNACLEDQKILAGVTAVHDQAEKKFGVKGTPTFFFNGHEEVGELTHDDIDKVLAPML